MEGLDLYKPLRSFKGQRIQLTSSDPFTPKFVQSNLAQASGSPDELYVARVKDRKILLENPLRESKQRKERQEKKEKQALVKAKRKRGLVGKKEARQKGIWKFDESQAKYHFFVPLHHLWMGYMSELLGLPKPSHLPMEKAMPSSVGMHPKLVKADFHGSLLRVHKSKNPSLVNQAGIVIVETENTFKVITKENKVKVLPKQNSIFILSIPLYSTLSDDHTADTPLPLPTAPSEDALPRTVLDVPHMEFELYGNQFLFRSADRAGRKFKPKETIEL